MQSLAFIGLGVMGYPMAGHLQSKGYAVTVYNRTEATAQRWVAQYGGCSAATPAQAAAAASVVFVCVGNDDDVRAVVLGEQGALSQIAAGSVLVDHSTGSANLARELAALCAQRGCAFVDAPVSGGQQGAERAALTVMCGGEAAVLARLQPLLDCYAQRVALMGSHGSGQLCKMVNQICVAGVIQGLAEGLHFARNAGLDLDAVFAVLSKGAAQSWQMENRHATMAAGDYQHGFAVDWMRKDLAYVLSEARSNGSQLPVTALIDQFYAEVQALGGGRWDTSSLLARLERGCD